MQDGPLQHLARQGRLVFGCGQLHKIVRRTDRERLVRQALDGGVLEFDVAPAYGNGVAERLLGDTLHAGRVKAEVVNTKAGIPIVIYPSSHWLAFSIARAADVLLRTHQGAYARRDFSPSALQSSLESSLRRLRLDAVKTFFLHEPIVPFEHYEWSQIVATMDNLVKQGKARAWGIAGPVARYRRAHDDLTQVQVVQLPMKEVERGMARTECARRISYSVYSAYRDARAPVSFESYLLQQSERNLDLSFVIATHDLARLNRWLGRSSS